MRLYGDRAKEKGEGERRRETKRGSNEDNNQCGVCMCIVCVRACVCTYVRMCVSVYTHWYECMHARKRAESEAEAQQPRAAAVLPAGVCRVAHHRAFSASQDTPVLTEEVVEEAISPQPVGDDAIEGCVRCRPCQALVRSFFLAVFCFSALLLCRTFRCFSLPWSLLPPHILSLFLCSLFFRELLSPSPCLLSRLLSPL